MSNICIMAMDLLNIIFYFPLLSPNFSLSFLHQHICVVPFPCLKLMSRLHKAVINCTI